MGNFIISCNFFLLFKIIYDAKIFMITPNNDSYCDFVISEFLEI